MLFKIFAAIAYIGMVVVNILANTLPIAGKTTDAISDSYQNLFTPTGLTFSIWGLIYLLLGIYTVYQFGLFQKNTTDVQKKTIKKIAPLFAFSSVVNIAWIFSWHYEVIWLSTVLMAGLIISLILIANVIRKLPTNTKGLMWFKAPFAVYFGWITVATIANIIILLVDLGWNGFGLEEPTWTIIILLIGSIIGIARAIYDKCGLYLFVFIWAYAGIIIKHVSESGFDGEHQSVITTAGICIALFIGGFAYIAIKALRKSK